MKRFNVSDPKWAHPELPGDFAWNTPGQDMLAKMSALLERDISPEEQDRMQAESLGMYAPFLDQLGWQDAFDKVEAHADGCPEEPDAKPVRIVALVPKDVQAGEKLPVVMAASGGAMTELGLAEMGLAAPIMYANATGRRMVMVSFDYRLAPGYRYPASINDCHAAFQWLVAHADEINADLDRVVFNGQSSGAHVMMAGAFRLKRHGWCGAPMPRGIVVTSPVMTDVDQTDSFTQTWFEEDGSYTNWGAETAMVSARLWLGDDFASPSVSCEAYPGHATAEDVCGYPPVWFSLVPEFDSARDTCYRFAGLLHEARVFCDLHVWGGTSHSSLNSATGATKINKRIMGALYDALDDAIDFDFRRQWLLEA